MKMHRFAPRQAVAVLAACGMAAALLAGCGSAPASSASGSSIPASPAPAASGAAESQSSAQIPNPVMSCTEQELLQATGLSFTLPEGAAEVSYSFIIGGDFPLAQVNYTLDGAAYTARAQAGNEAQDISGYFVEWPHRCTVQLGAVSGEVCLSAAGEGVLCWYDLHDGVNWCVSMGQNASADLLCEAAQAVYTTAMAGLAPDDDTVEAAYQKANEAANWFTMNGLPSTDYGCYKKGEAIYSRVDIPGISDMTDLTLYLDALFSPEQTKMLLDSFTVTDMLIEDGGKLYVLDAGRGSNIFMGEETHAVTAQSDTARLLTVTVDILGDDLKTVTGTEDYEFTYSLLNGRWVFTNFHQFR